MNHTTTNTPNASDLIAGQPYAFLIDSHGTTFVGIFTGDVNAVGTKDETVLISDAQRPTSDGEFLGGLMGLAFETLSSNLLTGDEADDLVLRYIDENVERARRNVAGAAVMHREAMGEHDRWLALAADRD